MFSGPVSGHQASRLAHMAAVRLVTDAKANKAQAKTHDGRKAVVAHVSSQPQKRKMIGLASPAGRAGGTASCVA